MNIAILGAGISGITAASRLHEKGHDVKVLEAADTVGGLARSRITDGYVYDPHGGHIFNSKIPKIKEWVFSVLPKENWHYSVRNAKIFFEGKYISYPFELSLHELPVEEALDCAFDYLMAQTGDEPKNYRDWLIWNFGRSIADYYLLPYNSKIWSYPLDKMETGWVHGKMPLPEKKEILRSLLIKDSNERKMPHSTFYYPLEGGIQTLVDKIAAPLNIEVDSPAERIEQIGRQWSVNGESFDCVVTTIPLPLLWNIIDLPEPIHHAIAGLKYNSVTTILFECPPTDISWLYIPNSKYKSHRISYQGALAPNAAPAGHGSGMIEVVGSKFGVDDHVLQDNVFVPEELEPKRVIDFEFSPFAYAIHDLHYRKNTELIRSYFSNLPSFHLLGRWGKWNYNNMDLCMNEAFELSELIDVD